MREYDAVIFFTTSTWDPSSGSHPLTESELRNLIAWVKGGGAFVAVHCGSDTLHNTPYGELVGTTFGGHPWVQKVRLHAEDPKHPAAQGLTEGSEILDEIYQFGDKPDSPASVPLKIQPYSRDRLHIILSVNNRSFDVSKGRARTTIIRWPGASSSAKAGRFTPRWGIIKPCGTIRGSSSTSSAA